MDFRGNAAWEGLSLREVGIMEEDLDVLRHALPCDRSLELEGITVDHDYLLIRFRFWCWWRGHRRSVQFLFLISSRL